ncbi:MAG: copper chaperone [Geobacter sp.]|nr:MAG: copper chaperone [Geobacter sp.]
MKNKVINGVILVAVVTLLSVLAFHVRIGVTADSVAVLRTIGMTCGSCSSKITKELEREKGVAVTEVDIAGGWVIVGYDTKMVHPEKLAQKVSETGFDSKVYAVLTPKEFRQIAGREIGKSASASAGCGGCGTKGGCGSQQ